MILALFYIVHVVVSLFLVGVVLLQQGKGADLSVFGGGSTMTAFGSRSATNFLHKMTVAAFIAFIVTTLSIGVMQRSARGSTLMDDVPVEAASESNAATPAADDAQGQPPAETQPAAPAETQPAAPAETPPNTDPAAGTPGG